MPIEVTSTRKARSRWPERLWMLLALLLIAIGTGTYGLGRLAQSNLDEGITREVMPQLEAADRIEAAAGALRGFNVLIITTDTTRADHIGCYGNQSVKTPVLDGLARDGILCAQAITPSPSTLPAHSSLMTGLYPVHHGARSNGTFRLDEKITTLAERLKAKGYRTGAVISAFVLDSRFGLDQGFDLYHDDLTKGMKYSPHMFRERAAELTNEPATQWLSENADQPFFLWVHYFDPHAVYLPPDPFRTEYADDLYDGEIAYADSQIGVLLEHLKVLGVRDRTLVIYTSDHGEGMGEHGEQTHSLLVYDATLHIPMIFHAPSGLPKGKVIRRQTCLVDVVPTVLALLGQELPEGLDGANLSDPPATTPRPILIETIATQAMHGWAPLVGVRRSDYKYILAPTPELYDLAHDPRELDNIHDREPGVLRPLTSELVRWLGDDPYLAARRAVDLSQLSVDKESLRKLSALGYVASAPSPTKPSEALRDPKEMIHRWELIQKGIHLQAEGQPKEAIPILEQCVAEVAGDIFTRGVLAGAYRQLGELDRAMAQFRLAAELGDDSAQVRLGMANVHVARQQFDDAEKEIAAALQIEPENAHAYVLRGQIAYARGQEEEAMGLYRKAIEMDPGSVGPSAYNQIGFVHLRAGRLADARDAFRNAIRIDALEGTAHDGLANILYLEGKVDQAMGELQLALRFNPNQPRALATLASLTSQQGDQQKALELCTRALELAPKLAAAHNNLGLIYRRQGKLDLAEKHYQKALEEDPRLDEAHVNLAQLYSRQGKTDPSLAQFRLAVEKNPGNPNPIALANLGVYHFNQGEFDKAYRFYRRALELHPDYALVHKYMASICALPDWDRPDLAAFHLRRSLELDPGQPEASQMRDLMARAQEEAARRSASTSQEPSLTPTETEARGDEPMPVRPTATGGTGRHEAD